MTDLLPLAPSDPNRPDPWKPMDELSADGRDALFDVIAKYYNASFDKFMVQRFCNCFRQHDKICWPNPFDLFGRERVACVILEDCGFRPIMWMPLPNNPMKLP